MKRKALKDLERAMTLLGKIARLRPLPESALSRIERDVADELQEAGLIRWDLASRGWTTTPDGLDVLGRR